MTMMSRYNSDELDILEFEISWICADQKLLSLTLPREMKIELHLISKYFWKVCSKTSKHPSGTNGDDTELILESEQLSQLTTRKANRQIIIYISGLIYSERFTLIESEIHKILASWCSKFQEQIHFDTHFMWIFGTNKKILSIRIYTERSIKIFV